MASMSGESPSPDSQRAFWSPLPWSRRGATLAAGVLALAVPLLRDRNEINPVAARVGNLPTLTRASTDPARHRTPRKIEADEGPTVAEAAILGAARI